MESQKGLSCLQADGKPTIPFKYDSGTEFYGNLASVSLHDDYFKIDKFGNEFDYLGNKRKNLFWIQLLLFFKSLHVTA